MPAPQVDFDGKTYVMTDGEVGRIVQPGPVVVLSRREVEQVLAVMERRVEANWPDARKLYGDKIKAYRDLLKQAGEGAEK